MTIRLAVSPTTTLAAFSTSPPVLLEEYSQIRGCKKFCVNGQLAGNCLTSRRNEDSRNKEESNIAGFNRPTAGWLPEPRRPDWRTRTTQATHQSRCRARPASRNG